MSTHLLAVYLFTAWLFGVFCGIGAMVYWMLSGTTKQSQEDED